MILSQNVVAGVMRKACMFVADSLTCMQMFGHANRWLAMKHYIMMLTLLLSVKIQKENIQALNTQ